MLNLEQICQALHVAHRPLNSPPSAPSAMLESGDTSLPPSCEEMDLNLSRYSSRSATNTSTRPACRAGIAPGFGTYPNAPASSGLHAIGFRIVQAPMPSSKRKTMNQPGWVVTTKSNEDTA